jgi:hypothetical protein
MVVLFYSFLLPLKRSSFFSACIESIFWNAQFPLLFLLDVFFRMFSLLVTHPYIVRSCFLSRLLFSPSLYCCWSLRFSLSCCATTVLPVPQKSQTKITPHFGGISAGYSVVVSSPFAVLSYCTAHAGSVRSDEEATHLVDGMFAALYDCFATYTPKTLWWQR